MICCYEMRKGRGSCVEPSSLKNFGSMFDAEAIHAQIPSNIEPNYHHHDPLTSLRLCVLTCHCERRVSSQARGVQTEFTGFRRRRLGGAGDEHTASRGFLTFAPKSYISPQKSSNIRAIYYQLPPGGNWAECST